MAGINNTLEQQLEAFTLGQLPLHKLLAEFDAAITTSPTAGQQIADLLENFLNQGEITITSYKQIKAELTLPKSPGQGGSTQAATAVSDQPAATDLAGELEETVFSAREEGETAAGDETSIDLDDFTEQADAANPNDDATEVAIDDDATAVVAETSGGQSSWTGGNTQGTGSSWSDPSSWVDSGEPLSVGAVIKERFELVQQLGIGGMGIVYKALDRRKVEAQDRDPYVAVKILNDEFKKHPKALQALQREARKTQELAHPNIMTVYDFDRVGTDVYMTMEFLDGAPMDEVIKKRKGKPFPEDEAMLMIEGMCEALGYAHRRNLVHSDFKPGNVFLTKKGTIKVLDFGIASRVTNPNSTGEDDGADKTVFDVKQFGAFTPAYATCEIMEGGEPNPKDDIYALGCVAYQLLGGKHPFNRKRATFARDNGLVPEPIPTLTRRQQKTLNKSLAFSHGECIASVEDFIDGMRRKKSRLVPIAAGIAALLIVTVFALRTTLVDYFQQQEHDRIIALLESPGQPQIISGLNELRQAEEPLRSSLVADAREIILSYYETQTGALIDDSQENYNFPKALGLVDEARELYPDSAQIVRMLDTIASRKSRLLNQLTGRFNAALESGSLLDQPEDDINDVLKLVKQIDPSHPLLSDPRLPPAYVVQAEKALTAKDYELASTLAAAGLENFPKNLSLINIKDEIQASRQQAQSQAKLAELAVQIGSRPIPTTVAGYDEILPSLMGIQQLEPENPLVLKYQSSFQAFTPNAVDQLISNHQWSEGYRLLADYGDLLTSDQIIEQQQKLVAANSVYDQQVAKLLAEFERSLGGDASSQQTLAMAEKPLAKLSGFAVGDDPNLRYARNRMGYGYLALARQSRSNNQLAESKALAELGSKAGPAGLIAESIATELALSDGGDVQKPADSASQLAAKFDAGLNQANDFSAAQSLLTTLDKIAITDPTSDKIAQGRSSLAERLANQVNSMITGNNWERAAELAQQSRLLLPELTASNTLMAKVDTARRSAEVAIRQQQIDSVSSNLDSLLADARFDSTWEAEVRGNWRRLRALLTNQPDRLKTEQNQLAQVFLTSAEQSLSKQLFVEARNKLRIGQRILPDHSGFKPAYESLAQSRAEFRKLEQTEAQAGQIKGLKQTLLTQTEARSLSEANVTFAKLKRLLPANDPFITQEVPNLLGPTYLEMTKSMGDQGKYVEALKLAKAGLKIAPEMGQLKTAYDLYENEAVLNKLATQFAAARGPSSQAVKILKTRIDSARQSSAGRADALVKQFSDLFATRATATAGNDKPAYRAWIARGREIFPDDTRFASVSGSRLSGRTCTAKIAGYGKRKAGVCYDVVAQKSRGPLLVVIPSAQPFAIGKYEISNQDFDLFCSTSGKCTATGTNPIMPASNVSYDQAVEYARWLSEQTGKTYRLPANEEWVQAATGDGNMSKDFNCLLKLGGNVIKGANLLPINSGKANSYGLHNPVGNVQEYIADGSVRGGAYKDTMSNCDISLKRSHSGSADGITGFRVLKEIQG